MAEIFPDDSMIASPLQEKARYLHGLSQELERTLMTVDGVIEARVHIVLPERTAGNDSLTPSSVAVFVKHNPDSPFQAYRGQIRNLVISSIPKMAESANDQNVSIVAIPASSRMEQPLALTWFGPLAIKSNDRFYLLGVIYLLIIFWVLSLASMYLSCVEPARRPKVLKNFFVKSKDKNIEEAAAPENELGALGK
jgi:type III secretion protein J